MSVKEVLVHPELLQASATVGFLRGLDPNSSKAQLSQLAKAFMHTPLKTAVRGSIWSSFGDMANTQILLKWHEAWLYCRHPEKRIKYKNNNNN